MGIKTTILGISMAVAMSVPVANAYEPQLPNQLVDPSVEQEPFEVAQDRGMSLDEAVNLVRSRVGGKVIRSETVSRNGKRTHKVRVLTKDGRMKTYHVDASTGRMR
ncbi:MAG: PepSY domain-containing protein [Pseudomonadota bacterium]